MSVRRSTGFPNACSGAMYRSLPFSDLVVVSLARVRALAMPKSITFTCPAYESSTFCGLTSRCTTISG